MIYQPSQKLRDAQEKAIRERSELLTKLDDVRRSDSFYTHKKTINSQVQREAVLGIF